MNPVRKLYHTLRWRLIPIRYAGKIGRHLSARPVPARFHEVAANDVGQHPAVQALHDRGHAPGPTIVPPLLAEIIAVYGPRSEQVVPTSGGHPFINLFRAEDIDPSNPVFSFAVSPQVLDVAHEYFGGKLQYDSIQVLHSWPTEGGLAESQLWHKDYGDSKSFHCVAYLNDVMDDGAGPFVYVDRNDTRRIARSLLVRRIDDATFGRELGAGTIRRAIGAAGQSIFVDPSACYHYGSRCQRPRLAVFITFSTDKPYVGAQPPLSQNGRKAAQAAAVLRPDLTQAYLDCIFGA